MINLDGSTHVIDESNAVFLQVRSHTGVRGKAAIGGLHALTNWRGTIANTRARNHSSASLAVAASLGRTISLYTWSDTRRNDSGYHRWRYRDATVGRTMSAILSFGSRITFTLGWRSSDRGGWWIVAVVGSWRSADRGGRKDYLCTKMLWDR